MGNNVIVLVSDLDNAIRGEINVLQDETEATRLVESLIESGFEQERIRVFLGDELQMEVRHRPVVSLSADAEQRTVKEVAAANEETPSPNPNGKQESPGGAAVRAASAVIDSIAEPFTKNGQKFSAQFGPDILSPA